MSHHHVAVWVDHAEAHIMHINPENVEKSIVHSPHSHQHLHHKRGAVGSGHAVEDQHYYHSIVTALQGAPEILIVGPGQAKLNLLKHIQAHDPAIANKVVGLETVDHPSDKQLISYARKYFVAKDRML